MKHWLPVFLLLFSSAAFAQKKEPAEWVTLFDGKTLDGWVQRGGVAKYTVEDGAIVGTTVPKTPNSFLCTEKEYGDFILELEFQVDSTLNCGVQIRSNSLPDYKDGRVHGYQVEIDPSDRAWSGGIYDEARRGWLDDHKDNPAARYAFRQNQWNQFRIEAVGARIRTFINGVQAADLIDAMTLKGFIGLQVHGIGNREETLQVRYRNIRIQDLGESKWQPLFNGKNLDGWTPTVENTWSVVDGVLKGASPKSEKRHSILLFDGKFDDFTLRTKYRSNSGNSGFYFRVDEVNSAVSVNGFQAEIDAGGNGVGGVYETGGRAWVQKPTQDAIEKFYRKGDWNEMDINAYGKRVKVQVNGATTVALENDPGRTSGKIGPQLHGSQDMDVEFSAIEILQPATDYRISDAEVKPLAKVTKLLADDADFRKLADGFKFTEGPALGPDGRIYFNDIPNERTHVYDPKTGKTEVFRENTGRANGLFFTAAGAMIACEGGNRRVVRIDGDEITVLADKWDGKKLNSPNDCALDSLGGLYFTDPRYGKGEPREIDVEAVYYISRKGKVTQATKEVTKPNGIIFSPDEAILYIADPGAETIWAFDVVGEGNIANRRKFAPVGSDGMTVDVHGNIYCTWKGELIAFAPDGKELLRKQCPEGPANCLLVGKTMYITARTGFYAIDLEVEGLR